MNRKADRDPVQFVDRAFLFGHYDSRGGATLIVGGRLSEAAIQYNRLFGIDDLDPSRHDRSDPAGDDLIGAFEVLVFDQAMPDEGELLQPYDGDFKAGRLQRRWGNGRVWEDDAVLVLWTGKRPIFPKTDFFEYRVRPWDLGEDAFGLVVG